MMHVGFEQIHRQRGNQRSRKHIGSEHREHHRLGQREEQIARHAGEEEHRQKHDANTQRGDQRGKRDLRRAIQNAGVQIFALIEIAVDVFDG